MKLEEALQQRKFINPVHKAHLNIIYTAAWLNQRSTRALKQYDLSVQQFNILRILRGMHPEPATIKLLTERMIDKMSNASRLVEKLKQKGWVERLECSQDRRRVDITITEAGLAILVEASAAIDQVMFEDAETLAEAEAHQLSDLLDKLRSNE